MQLPLTNGKTAIVFEKMFATKLDFVFYVILISTSCPILVNTQNMSNKSDICFNALKSFSVPLAYDAVQFKQLCDSWCAPYVSNNASEVDSFLSGNIASSTKPRTMGQWCAEVSLPSSLSTEPYWAVDAYVMYWRVWGKEMKVLDEYIIMKNYSVDQSVTNKYCSKYLMSNFGFAAYFYLFMFSFNWSKPVVGYYLTSSLMFLWAPFAIMFFILSLLVLRRVVKDLGKDGMPCQILYKAELVSQLVSFLWYPTLYNLNLPVLLFTPFCFMSASVASRVFGNTFITTYFRQTECPFWVSLPLLKCAIAAERVFLFYFPVTYSANIDRARARRFFFSGLLLYIVFCLASYCTLKWTTVEGMTRPKSTPITATYWLCWFVLFVCLHIVLAIMIALKLFKTKGAVLDDDEWQQRRRQINRHIGKMIVVCTCVNMMMYFFVILYLLASGFNTGDKCPGGICGDWYWANVIWESNFWVVGTVFAVDLNSSICFIVQCVFLQAYRQAAKDVVIRPFINLAKHVRGICTKSRAADTV